MYKIVKLSLHSAPNIKHDGNFSYLEQSTDM